MACVDCRGIRDHRHHYDGASFQYLASPEDVGISTCSSNGADVSAIGNGSNTTTTTTVAAPLHWPSPTIRSSDIYIARKFQSDEVNTDQWDSDGFNLRFAINELMMDGWGFSVRVVCGVWR